MTQKKGDPFAHLQDSETNPWSALAALIDHRGEEEIFL